MITLVLFLLICSIYPGCMNVNRDTGIMCIVNNTETKAPVLWTVDWSPDGKFIAVGGNDMLLRIYEWTGFKLINSYKLPGSIQCLDWNPNGELLAIALDDSAVQLFNTRTAQFSKLGGIPGSRALAWNYNGELLAIGDYEGLLQIWDKKGKLLKIMKKENTKTYLSVDWHPKKDIILTGSDRIRLFDTSGTILQNIKHRIAETIILTVKWHPDGTFFTTGDYGYDDIESLLQFWKEDGTMISSLGGSKAEYRNIRWNKDGTFLATASDALRLWSKGGKMIYTGKSENLLWGVDWSSKTENIVTTSGKGDISLWTGKAQLVRLIH